MTTNNYIELKDSAFFEISGADKSAFLQGLITNDINKCTKNISIYSAFLSPQGKFVADFFIVNLGNSFLFETRKKFIDDLIDKFNFYKLRADIEIKKIENYYKSLAIIFRKEIFSELKLPGESKNSKELSVYVDPRKAEMGIKVIVETNEFNKFCNEHSLLEDSLQNYNKKRMEYLIPDSLVDLEVNKSVLLENNFESLNAIDWNKGCYIGQEITARMKYRSLLKKSITRIQIIEGQVKANDEIFLEDIVIGKIISIIETTGLAMLKIYEAKKAFDENIALKTKQGKVMAIFK